MSSRFNKNGINLSKAEEDDWLKANASPVEEAPKEKAPQPETTAKASEPKGTPAKGDSQETPRRGLSIRRNRKEKDNG